jgi:hypothetical protein
MRRFLWMMLIFWFGCAGPRAQYSAFTLRFLNDLEQVPRHDGNPVLDEAIKRKYLVRETGEGDVVHGFLTLTPDFDPNRLADLGVAIQSRNGDICTAVIPVRALRKLGRIKGISSIEINSPLQKKDEVSP